MRLTFHRPPLAASFVSVVVVAAAVAASPCPATAPSAAPARIVADAVVPGGVSSDGYHALADVVGLAVAGASADATHRLDAGFRAVAVRLAAGVPTPVLFGDVDVSPADASMMLRWTILAADGLRAVRVYRRAADDESAPWVRLAELGPAAVEYRDASVAPGRRYVWRVGAVDAGGEFLSPPVEALTPAWTTRLEPNVPNPFNPRTRIRFVLGSAGPVRVDVFDARGRRVRTLVAGTRAAGRHEVTWDGRDARGRVVASGVYFCRLRTRGVDVARKMMLLK